MCPVGGRNRQRDWHVVIVRNEREILSETILLLLIPFSPLIIAALTVRRHGRRRPQDVAAVAVPVQPTERSDTGVEDDFAAFDRYIRERDSYRAVNAGTGHGYDHGHGHGYADSGDFGTDPRHDYPSHDYSRWDNHPHDYRPQGGFGGGG